MLDLGDLLVNAIVVRLVDAGDFGGLTLYFPHFILVERVLGCPFLECPEVLFKAVEFLAFANQLGDVVQKQVWIFVTGIDD